MKKIVFLILSNPLLTFGQADHCQELRKSTIQAMSATGSKFVADYDASQISPDIQIDIYNINNGEIKRAFYIRKRTAIDGFILMELADRFELYGALNDYVGTAQIPTEIWHAFRASNDPQEYYELVFLNSPLFSLLERMRLQQNCN